MSRTGRNVNRDISNLTNRGNITEDIASSRTFGSGPTLQKAVVIDVVIDPNSFTDEHLTALRDSVNNPEFIDIMPVNSIIAKMVSDSQGQMARTNTILFPFFSSHFMLPVQPGEIVNVIYDDYLINGYAVGYWMTRTSAERTIEDANYTHLDRRYDPSNNPGRYSTDERDRRESTQPVPGFPNGGMTPGSFTLSVTSSSDEPYERIVTSATAYLNGVQGLENLESDGQTSIVTPEPVPRWRKRPQEFILQGANNTLICLGEDRKGSPFGAVDGETLDAKGQAGTVDIVAGRGRFLPEDPSASREQQLADSERSPNAPLIVENSRNNLETDKTPYKKIRGETRLKDAPTEGDPDFVSDASRLYISMQSEADNNFGLTEIEYTENTKAIVQPSEGTAGTANKAYLVGKSDHIRFIARSDINKEPTKNIDGTIALIREGISEDEEDGLSLIYLDKQGIQIEAPKIYLGRGLADLAGADENPTPGGEPYIRWSKYRDTVKRLQEEMDEMRNNLQQQIDTVANELQNMKFALATAFQTSNCVPFSPDPALTTAAAQLQAASAGGRIPMGIPAQGLNTQRQTLTNNLTEARKNTSNDVEKSKSSKIFGE